MIAQLTGEVISKAPPQLVLNVNGVGYQLLCPMSSFYQLQNKPQHTFLTELIVREDAHTLYGFIAEDERELFRLLIKVNGVGPKAALAMLSAFSVADLVTYVINEDFKQIQQTPGIGLKTAQKLVLELKDKLNKFDVINRTSPHLKAKNEQAMLALKSLGFNHKEIDKMLSNINDDELSTEELIRLALQNK